MSGNTGKPFHLNYSKPMNQNIVGLGLFALVFTGACSSEPLAEKKEKFKVIKPFVADTAYNNEYVAEINALQNVELRSQISGLVENILIDEGQTVEQGQTLFMISSSKYRQELHKAKAALKSAMAGLHVAEIELENARRLADKNIISQSELAMARVKLEARQADVAEAEANEEQAKLHLSYTEIKAPFKGIINRIPYKRGSLVEEGTLLTTISDNNEMFAYFNVSEKEYLDYIISQSQQRPQDVTLMLVNGTPYSHSGKIETVESEFDASTGSIAFRVRFANPDGILKHGANGKIVVQQAVKNAIIIPQKSTFEIQDKLFVFVVNKDNKVEQRNIIPKMRIPHLYIVESGISKDERILFEGAQQLRSGDLIEPEPVGREDIALLIRPLR